MSQPKQATQLPKRNRRSKRWTPGGLHLKLAVTTFSVAMVVLSFSLLANLLGWTATFRDPPPNVDAALGEGYSTLFQSTLFSLLFAIPFTGWVAMTYLFKICGPLYAIRRNLRRISEGNWNVRCHIRKEDELQDLNDDINRTIDALIQQVRNHDELLRDVRDSLGYEALPALRERINEEIRAVSQRLEAVTPEPATNPTT